MKSKPKYRMTISRLTVDKLGVKLYDRVSAVIAEVVANSYDADAEEVIIVAPMGEALATKADGKITDRGFFIEVSDDGIGMTVEEVNDFYLKVGSERRTDARRGDLSGKFHRKVMGRKGVGKLAPFGVCRRIEVITSGGDQTRGTDEHGKIIRGYETCHLILDRRHILKDVDTEYNPDAGKLDGVIRPKKGTTIRMTGFDHRLVPKIDDFERQMAQRFGLKSEHWRIVLRDSKGGGGKNAEREVGTFEVKVKAATRLAFNKRPSAEKDSRKVNDYFVKTPPGVEEAVEPGFFHEGSFYPITGWVAYADSPYKDQLMAGVRIYCRGKIAAQTALFDMRAGFTGEHDVRSYLIGELHTDWLDEGEDLIRTDRQDILWSQDVGLAFQKWGQDLVKAMGRITREPMRQSAWEIFKEKSSIEERLEKTFPGERQKEIREQTLEMAQTIAKTMRGEELDDKQTVESFVQLSFLLGPHITLDAKLREAANSQDRPLAVVSAVLQTARIAELASFGRIADDRIKVIDTVERLKDGRDTPESEFQKLLNDAPWLINPSWSPITANQSFETLKREFAKFYKRETGNELLLDPFAKPNKRSDFVLSSQDEALQIIEIKRPHHALANEEMDRIVTYQQLMSGFLNEAGNQEFAQKYPSFHITLVCDKINVSGTQKAALEGFRKQGILTHINWKTFLLRTRKAHEGFLNEADRQRRLASK